MTKSVTKIQDKDSRKRLSVVRSKEDPTKYGIVMLNPDGSMIGGGNVKGPESSVDGNVALFNGTSGKKIKDSGKKLGDATITIQRNSCNIGCFTTNQESNSCINISVPTQACDVCALPDTTKYGASLDMSINSCNYCLTMQLKDQDGCNLGTACSVDLPIESMVVNACYLCDTREIELILQNGCCICFGVGDLVCGLQSEITTTNKIGSDCVSDTNQCNKFVTETEKCCISTALQGGDNISCLCNDCGYITGITCNDVTTALGYSPAQCCDIPTDNCQLANGCGYIKGINCGDVTTALGYTPYNCTNPCGYTSCTGTVVASDLQPYAKSCDLCAVATSGKYCDLSGRVTDNCQIGNGCGYTTCTGTLVASDLNPYAKTCTLCTVATSGKYCDLTGTPTIPTDNCQLGNGCGYIKGINCSDVTTALGYTPYNATNPCGYTTCTGTLVSSDIQNLAQCCDIPTDNCQLGNSCGYTTCVGDVVGPSSSTNGNIAVFDGATGKLVKDSKIPIQTFVITEDMITKTTTATKGVAPYNTNYYYTNFEIDDTKGISRVEGGIYYFVWNSMTAASSYRNVRIRIGANGDWMPLLDSAGTIISGYAYVKKNINVPYIYSTKYQSGGALHYHYDANTTYSAMSQAEIDAGTATSCRTMSAVNLRYAISTYGGNMKYEDFAFETKTGSSIELSLNSKISPSENFTVNVPSEIKEGQQYILRVENGGTVYTMTLGSGFTNPASVDLTLTPNNTDMFVFLATSSSELELQPNFEVTNDEVINALGYTPYNSSNPNGYTTCTGTLTSSDLCCYAKCCDIPTDNCQLANGCGYTTCTGTLSSCSDITTALGFTPYSAANPCGYTTCTGTLTSSDLACYACCCDIPTNNCQLTNGCGYTTCTGTLQSCDIACINGCCLTIGGNICIQGEEICTLTQDSYDDLPSSKCCDGKYYVIGEPKFELCSYNDIIGMTFSNAKQELNTAAEEYYDKFNTDGNIKVCYSNCWIGNGTLAYDWGTCGYEQVHGSGGARQVFYLCGSWFGYCNNEPS